MKRFLITFIIGVFVCALIIGAIIIVTRHRCANTLQRARDAFKDCDDMEFINYKWPSECIIDDDGLNAEPLEVRRKAILDMLDAAATGSGVASSTSVVYAKKQGKRTLVIMLYPGSFVVFTPPPCGFRVEGVGTLRIFQLPAHSEAMEKTKEILAKCDDIQFSAEGCRSDFLDAEGLNAEPLEKRREVILELFSEYNPREKGNESSFTGKVFLKKGDKIILKIALYESGFMMRGRYFDVLNPERNETMLRLLNFKKLQERQESP